MIVFLYCLPKLIIGMFFALEPIEAIHCVYLLIVNHQLFRENETDLQLFFLIISVVTPPILRMHEIEELLNSIQRLISSK